MNNEKYKKSLTTKIKFFTFIFGEWKRIYFARKHSLGKWSLCNYIYSKVSFCVGGYLKGSNETPTSTKISTGLVDVALWPKILGNGLGIVMSVLIANDYFSSCYRKYFQFRK